MYYPLAIAAGLATLAFLQGCQGCRVKKIELEGGVDTASPPDETGDSTIPPETGETGDTGGDEYIFTEKPRVLIHFNNGGIGSIISVNVEELLDAAKRIFEGETDARPEDIIESSEELPVGRLINSGEKVFLLGATTLTQIDPTTGNPTGDDYNSWFTDFVMDNPIGEPLDVQYSPVTGYTYVPFEFATLIINPDGSEGEVIDVSEGDFGRGSSTWMNGPGGVDNNGIYYQSVNLWDSPGFVTFNGDSADHDNDSIADTDPLYSGHLLFNPSTNLFYATNESGFISLDPANATDGEVPVEVVIHKEDFARSGVEVRDGVSYDFRDPHFTGGTNNFSSIVNYEWEEDGATQYFEELAITMSTGFTFVLSDPEEPDAYSELLDTVSALTRSGSLVMTGLETDEVHVWRYETTDTYTKRTTLPGDGLFAEYGTPVSLTGGTLSEEETWSDFPWELGGWFYEEG